MRRYSRYTQVLILILYTYRYRYYERRCAQRNTGCPAIGFTNADISCRDNRTLYILYMPRRANDCKYFVFQLLSSNFFGKKFENQLVILYVFCKILRCSLFKNRAYFSENIDYSTFHFH